MAILVFFASVEGHTRKIAETVAALIEDRGKEVALTEAGQIGFCDPGTYEAAILCAPIHIGEYPPGFTHFIQNWKASLKAVPTALVTVSLAVISDDPAEREEAAGFPDRLAEKTGWQADYTHNAAGALKYLEYDFFKRWVMRRIAAEEGGPVDTGRDHELTDWQALEDFIVEFLEKTGLSGTQ